MNKRSICHFLLAGGALLAVSGCAAGEVTKSDATAPATKITVGGSSEAYEVLEQLADAYTEKADHVAFEFFPPSQTSGGIEGVKSQALDIGGLSRPLTTEESESLNYLPLADTPLVLVAHNSVTGVSDISADELRAIYSGDITNWEALGGPNEEIVLLDFTEDENEKIVLREAYLGADLEVTADAVVFAEDDELIETAGITEFSFAAVPLEDELEEMPMTILSIEGVMPSAENVGSGDYAMLLPLGMAVRRDLSAEAQAFVDFVEGGEGQQILAAAGDGLDDSE